MGVPSSSNLGRTLRSLVSLSVMGTTVICRCGVVSSMCSTADTTFSLPNSFWNQPMVFLIHSSSLPSASSFFIVSSSDVQTKHKAITALSFSFRVFLLPSLLSSFFLEKPASCSLFQIARVRPIITVDSMHSRLRIVRESSRTLAGRNGIILSSSAL